MTENLSPAPDQDKDQEQTKEEEDKINPISLIAPPPPGDWTTHPITKTIYILVLIAIGILLWIKLPQWFAFMEGHPYGTGLTVFVLFALALIVAMIYWRTRAMGRRGDSWWKPD